MDDSVTWPGAFAVTVPVSALLVGVGLIVRAIAARAADGRLGRNPIAGIRTRTTGHSDETWIAAHRAGRPLTERGASTFVLTGALSVVIAAPMTVAGGGDAGDYLLRWIVLLLVGIAVATGLVVAGAVVGQRAASDARDGVPGSGEWG